MPPTISILSHGKSTTEHQPRSATIHQRAIVNRRPSSITYIHIPSVIFHHPLSFIFCPSFNYQFNRANDTKSRVGSGSGFACAYASQRTQVMNFAAFLAFLAAAETSKLHLKQAPVASTMANLAPGTTELACLQLLFPRCSLISYSNLIYQALKFCIIFCRKRNKCRPHYREADSKLASGCQTVS